MFMSIRVFSTPSLDYWRITADYVELSTAAVEVRQHKKQRKFWGNILNSVAAKKHATFNGIQGF